MPKKTEKKKQQYQQWCKQQALAGKVNRQDGVFVERRMINPQSSMVDNYSPQPGKMK